MLHQRENGSTLTTLLMAIAIIGTVAVVLMTQLGNLNTQALLQRSTNDLEGRRAAIAQAIEASLAARVKAHFVSANNCSAAAVSHMLDLTELKSRLNWLDVKIPAELVRSECQSPGNAVSTPEKLYKSRWTACRCNMLSGKTKKNIGGETGATICLELGGKSGGDLTANLDKAFLEMRVDFVQTYSEQPVKCSDLSGTPLTLSVHSSLFAREGGEKAEPNYMYAFSTKDIHP